MNKLLMDDAQQQENETGEKTESKAVVTQL